MKCVLIKIKNLSKMYVHEGRTQKMYQEVDGYFRVVRFLDDIHLDDILFFLLIIVFSKYVIVTKSYSYNDMISKL